MRKIAAFLPCAFLLVTACFWEDSPQKAETASYCRVEIPVASQETWPSTPNTKQHNAQPDGDTHLRLLVSRSVSGLTGEESEYQLFWAAGGYLYQSIRGLDGSYKNRNAKEPKQLTKVSAWDATLFNNQPVIAFAKEKEPIEGEPAISDIHELYLFQNETLDENTRKQILISEIKSPISDIVFKIQGQTGLILYTTQSTDNSPNETPTVYAQLVDLCVFYTMADSMGCPDKLSPELIFSLNKLDPNINEEDGETIVSLHRWLINSNPFFLGHGQNIKLVGFQSDSFLAGIQDGNQWRILQIVLPLSGSPQKPIIKERTNLSGNALSFSRSVSSALSFSYQADKKSLHIETFLPDSLSTKTSDPKDISIKTPMNSMIEALSYYNDSKSRDGKGFAALWRATGLLDQEGALVFARVSENLELIGTPLWVLPSEDIKEASMAVVDNESRLQFGIFYQPARQDAGLNFVRVACSF